MKPNFGMLWQGNDAQAAIKYFTNKYKHAVDFVLARSMPSDCPKALFIEDKTIGKKHMLIGSYKFKGA